MRKPSTLLTLAIFLASTMATQPAAHAGGLKSWDKKTEGAGRWKLLGDFGGAAVLDKETGLVWELSPSGTTSFTYDDAITECAGREFAGRRGFRVPAVGELSSLVSTGAVPPLPPDHPFQSVLQLPGDAYWTMTPTYLTSGGAEYRVVISGWDGAGTASALAVDSTAGVWCVRGPGGN